MRFPCADLQVQSVSTWLTTCLSSHPVNDICSLHVPFETISPSLNRSTARTGFCRSAHKVRNAVIQSIFSISFQVPAVRSRVSCLSFPHLSDHADRLYHIRLVKPRATLTWKHHHHAACRLPPSPVAASPPISQVVAFGTRKPTKKKTRRKLWARR